LLRSDQYRCIAEKALADDDTVIQSDRLTQHRQMRTDAALRRRHDFAEAAGVEQCCNTLSCRAFQIAAGRGSHRAIAYIHASAHARPPHSSTACIRRRLTTAGVAPASLIVTTTSPRR